MNKIKKILIIEDEEANSNRLKRIIVNLRSNYQILEVLCSIQKSVEWLASNEQPDLLFMDVQLSDGVSFEIFNLVEVKCPVIFTTAYDEYSIKAFKYNSIDYLLKPVEQAELEFALTKFENLTKYNKELLNVPKDIMNLLNKKEYRTRFITTNRDGFKQIQVESISYFFSEFGATYAMSFTGEKNHIAHTLESLEEELDSKQFFRANRQYIVHINSINQVHNYFNSKLKLDVKQNKKGVLVSRLKAASFKEWLDY
ncbi:LytTR family DNA-binding domain-containing protein [Algoriphagus sp. AGSA1]|uniref:LytR/AlgR family response regulator transcription factor n=1 Tax=Algoriphagus sp. AGSA1 TaxID=2907213 RepID=UPI001F23FC20|nr:LytTR family DNA-binding domain-containing protein [Algoriphagus sp. AGSA1]MCE7054263.1 LytTR family DNA-binding domain-containing protein [Algoriphagus sp. AGSA1]